MKALTTCLWFDKEAEEAAKLYTSVFPNSSIGTVTRYDEASSKAAGRPVGSVMTVAFTLNGHEFLGLNGGPVFKPNESVSLMINCDTQAEIDHYWSKLTADGGKEVECGWLKDRFGFAWQVVPSRLEEWTRNPARYARVMKALLTMKKLDLAALERAAA